MVEAIQIMTVKKDDGDGLSVTFSDGTTAGYVAEELLELRPHRELVEEFRKSKIAIQPDRIKDVSQQLTSKRLENNHEL